MTWSRARLEISGVLAPFEVGFTEWLGRKGYTPAVVRIHQRRMTHLSHWMGTEEVDMASFGLATVDAFIAVQDAAGRFKTWRAGSWAELLEYLRFVGVPVADRPKPVMTSADALLARYADYEATERGLCARTIDRNVLALRPFVESRIHDGWLALEALTAGEVTSFVVDQARRDPRSVPHMVTALRSLLRYLHVAGVIPVGLASAVPTLARWKLAGLPKVLPADQVVALLASCDPRTEVGQRDTAILTVLSRLGLRVGEVAGLRLEDIDWRNGELAVTGKGQRAERLPLPADVGQAIVSYLTGWRPKTGARQVFLCACAPHGAMSRNTVTNVVARAARRAGLGVMHAHRLRHSAATAMLTAGASLAEIGQVLRHRHGACADHHDLCESRRRLVARGRPPLAGIGGCRMNALRDALADYLNVRRALGSKLDRAEKLLGQFVSYLEFQHADVITVEYALAWATLPQRSGWWHAMRLSTVRRFAVYLRNVDDRTQVPPPGLIAHGKHRATPYLYSDAEIHALVQAATRLHTQVCAATYPVLISLLAVTGMRFGEAIALDVNDFDSDAEVLTVRDGKFGKSRLLPLHSSTADGLRHYLGQRNQLLRNKNLVDSGALLISNAGTRLDHSRAQRTWRKLRTSAGLAPRSGNCRPRIHDLRHSFAVTTLLDWYRRGEDVPSMLPKLSTYLGHADPKDTFWYLSAAPELLALAGQRLDTYLAGAA